MQHIYTHTHTHTHIYKDIYMICTDHPYQTEANDSLIDKANKADQEEEEEEEGIEEKEKEKQKQKEVDDVPAEPLDGKDNNNNNNNNNNNSNNNDDSDNSSYGDRNSITSEGLDHSSSEVEAVVELPTANYRIFKPCLYERGFQYDLFHGIYIIIVFYFFTILI